MPAATVACVAQRGRRQGVRQVVRLGLLTLIPGAAPHTQCLTDGSLSLVQPQ